MLVNLYCVYDAKAAYYLPVFAMRTHGEAMRAMAQAANDPSSQVGAHPEDYILYHVGTFDDQAGAVESVRHEPICKGIELINYPPTADLFSQQEEK